MEEMKLLLILKLCPYWLAFIVLEGATYDTGREQLSNVLPSVNAQATIITGLATYAHWYNVTKYQEYPAISHWLEGPLKKM